MQIFDSHCHLDDSVYDADRKEVLARARAAGVTAAMVVGIDGESARRAVALADAFPGLYASVGLHPHDATACSEALLQELTRLARHPRVRAWGETGLDFNRLFSPREVQERWFERQLETARDLQLPLIFHERDSQGRFLAILRASGVGLLRGVVHCFAGRTEELDAYLDLGLSIGITGILTHAQRGAELRRQVVRVPVERLLVETDAPYLTPTPERNRHRRNEPAFVRTTLLKLAEVRGEDAEALAASVWANTCRLFGVDG
jgi:TatD DNase family protein